ncbi:MAG: histone deacetylase [SAR324 cluster bacterium]|nr:histone deacetylase [SAR324 cluster bacterium]
MQKPAGMQKPAENSSKSAGCTETVASPGSIAYWHYDHLSFPLPEQHRYPRGKYRLVRELLLAEGALAPRQLTPCEPATWELLALLHKPAYLETLRAGALTPQAERELGLPVTHELVLRARAAVWGTQQAALSALSGGAAANLGGGNHHGFPGRGTGYCLLNDIAVAIRYLQQELLVERIAIVDLDVHQGNANAEIFRHDPAVFTLSVHGARNWPYRKAESDLDLALPDGTGDESYLAAIEPVLLKLYEHFRPDLVFYQAGVDPLASDRLGRLALSLQGLRRRDRLVLELSRDHHCPLVVTMGGGYARDLADTVRAHANTFRELEAVWGRIA